jgi:lipopolysaccharide transport system ATP-binding protein
MSKPAITVEKLSKLYMIDHQKQATDTVKDAVAQALQKPFSFLARTEKERFWALKDVSFNVNRGDVVGIIGRNGSGKSTLLKILSRIAEPTEGQAILRGNVASLLEVGTGFHPELTGRENIYFNGAILGMRQKEIRQKFDEIVAFSEVEQFLDTPVKFYSSGMYVRLAFAVAAHLDPEILIVDEVLAVGDAQFQKKCLGRMEDISKAGRTVLFVSHNMGAVRDLCTKGVLMNKGQATHFDQIGDAISAYQKSGLDTEGSETTVKVKGRAISFHNFKIGDLPLHQQPDVFGGEPLKVSLDYDDDAVHDYDLCVGLTVRNKRDGSAIIYTHSHLEEVRHRTGDHAHLDVRLKVPHLAPDVYSVELNIWLDGDHLVHEEPIGEFRIVATPVFASNLAPSSFPSTLMVESTWKFK